MSRKTHSHKGTSVNRNRRLRSRSVASRPYNWRVKLLAVTISFVLLGGGTVAHWRTRSGEDLIARSLPGSANNHPPILASGLDIPPEAFDPKPQMDYGYNAHGGGLPPGALPPGVVLPGVSLMQGDRASAQGYGPYDGIRQQFTQK